MKRFRIVSLLVMLMFLMVPVAIGLALSGLLLGENRLLLFAAIAVAVGIFCLIVNFLQGGRLRCPLCMVPPLQNRGCSKHRSAKTMLGSHRLKVAHSIIFADSFRCPYCGEPTTMQVRQRGGR